MTQPDAMTEAERSWMIDTLLALLQTPSPTGRTDAVMQLIGEILDELGVPFSLTRRGALIAELPGESATTDRAIVVHADTIGAMVSGLKDNGRLELISVGTFSARFAAGARVRIFCDESEEFITGTILPLKASGHAFGDAVDTQPTDWDHIEVRVDRRVSSREDLSRLGIKVGDFVALAAGPELTHDGFVVSRHLDDQAGVAVALTLAKHVADNMVTLPHRTAIMITIAEEVGYGASTGLPAGIAEMITVDNAVCAPGLQSIEDGVTVLMADLHGPYDYHLSRRLCRLAEERDIRFVRDVFRFYRSDAAAAIEAGASTRAALVGPGVDGSHGWERTHLDSLEATYQLLHAWVQTPLTFGEWDANPSGKLRDFPSSKQPAPSEQWVPLSRGGNATAGQACAGGVWPAGPSR
ncbi:MAG: osmoprotectant NAGGN system M42 family peptidase [Actinomycetota bacterium]|nr:osmoprotectant NAGGN system M42 family peptidase [Actinomycetota bacterium]